MTLSRAGAGAGQSQVRDVKQGPEARSSHLASRRGGSAQGGKGTGREAAGDSLRHPASPRREQPHGLKADAKNGQEPRSLSQCGGATTRQPREVKVPHPLGQRDTRKSDERQRGHRAETRGPRVSLELPLAWSPRASGRGSGGGQSAAPRKHRAEEVQTEGTVSLGGHELAEAQGP